MSEEPVPAVSVRRMMRSEWIKLRSVRSTVISMCAVAVVAIGVGAISSASGDGGGPGDNDATDPVSLSLSGFSLAELIIGVVGVLVATSEYSSGLIRTTLAAAGSRLTVLGAKAAVYAGTILAVAGGAALAAFILGQAVYSGPGPTAAIGDPGVLRSIVGTAGYCAGVGLLGIALGFLLRSTAGGIFVLVATLLVVPGLLGLLPWSWTETFTMLLPSNAADAFTSGTPASELLSPVAGMLAFTAVVVALLAAAAFSLVRRDP
jgi:ABC-2 type transport system permease protein